MSYEPYYTISPRLLTLVEAVAALRERIQGAMDLLRPLLEAGMVEKIGGKKTGHYALRKP